MSDLTLRKIDEKFLEMLNIDMDEEALTIAMNAFEFELKEKVEGVAYVIRQAESYVEQLKQEENRIKDRRKAFENRIEWLKQKVDESMRLQNLDKLETAMNTISYRKSTKTIIEDESKIPKEYKQQRISYKVDKIKIKDDIQSGKKIPGARLQENQNIQFR